MGLRAVAAATVAALALAIVVAPGAQADDWALNGRYLATSNGDWAMFNDVYRDIPSVRSTWTITMTCSNRLVCAGQVSSDAGWSADIVTTNTEYVVTRELLDWQRCADGTGRTVTGHQRYRFFPVDERGFLAPGSRVFAGFDKTSGQSGGCSLSMTAEVELPFRLEELD